MQLLDHNLTIDYLKFLKKIELNSISINSTEFEVIEKFDNLNLIKNSDSNISHF